MRTTMCDAGIEGVAPTVPASVPWPARRGVLRAAGGALLGAAGLRAAAAADPVAVQPIARGLANPWAVAFLPDGRMLVTERVGRLRIVDAGGRVGPALAGLPPVAAGGQGGLLDVVLSPGFAADRLVFWSYAEPGDAGTNGTAVARGRLDGAAGAERLDDVRVIFRQAPKVASTAHFGSRLAFAPDGRLFVTLGDRFSRKDDAQVLSNTLGKIVRIEPDGRVPADNPLAARAAAGEDVRAEIWSWGHRNVQGAAVHPGSGRLWAHEHGPQGGDEVNVVQPGRNHGWPVITFGRNYGSGTTIGEGTARADVVAPVRHWVPLSIAPSGMAFLTSDRYAALPGWTGSVFLGALRGEALVRLELDGERVVREERLLTTRGERIRDVREAPDGHLVVLTDNADGRLLRVVPRG